MATLDQQGNVLPDTPLQDYTPAHGNEIDEVQVVGRRRFDWNGVLTALVAAGIVYLFNELTRPARRRRRRA